MAPGRPAPRRARAPTTISRCAAARRRSPSRSAAPTGYDDGRQKAQLRGLAELALSDALATGSPAQASRAGNLLGILAATDESGSDASVSDRRAAETFEAAIRADPGERGREVQPRADPAPDQGRRVARGRGRLVGRLRPVADGRRSRAAGVGLLMLASVSLLAPYGLLACLLALVPLAVVALAFRRQRRVSRALGLEPASGRRAARAAALPAVACLLLGVAIAQPAVTTTTERSARTSSEVVFVADVSRSMTASSGPGAAHPARPRAIDRRGSSARPCPTCRPGSAASPIASCRTRFRRSTGRHSPRRWRGACRWTRRRRRRSRTSPRASSRSPPSPATASTGRAPSIAPASSSPTARRATDISWNGGCRLLVVRVGSATDRIYAANGKVDAAYRPESTAADTVGRLARAAGSAAVLRGRRGSRRGGAATRRRRRPEPPGRDGAVGPRAGAALRRARPRRCCARPRPALSSTCGWRLTRSEASKGRHGWGLEEDWWSGSASKRPCRAHACARSPGRRNGRRRLVVGQPAGRRGRRLARIRPHGRQQPLLAADGHHAGERRPARPRLHEGLPRDRSRHEARPAVVPARDRRHALRDDERRERLRDRRRHGQDPLAAQADRTARSSRTSASPPTAASPTAAASSSSSSST